MFVPAYQVQIGDVVIIRGKEYKIAFRRVDHDKRIILRCAGERSRHILHKMTKVFCATYSQAWRAGMGFGK